MLIDEVVEPSPPNAANIACEARASMAWERQANETSRQFASFQTYRDTHPTVRSLAKVGQQLGCSTTYIERLSAQWKWVDRASAWDEERDRRRQVRLLNHAEELERRHLEIASAALLKIGQRLADLAPADIKVEHIPRLLEAVLRVQEVVLGEPRKRPDDGHVINATELRKQLKAGGLLSTHEHEPQQPVSQRLAAWARGDDLDAYDLEHK